MVYDLEKYSEEIYKFEFDHKNVRYLKPIPLPNWMVNK
jgi:hypothetical protein